MYKIYINYPNYSNYSKINIKFCSTFPPHHLLSHLAPRHLPLYHTQGQAFHMHDVLSLNCFWPLFMDCMLDNFFVTFSILNK